MMLFKHLSVDCPSPSCSSSFITSFYIPLPAHKYILTFVTGVGKNTSRLSVAPGVETQNRLIRATQFSSSWEMSVSDFPRKLTHVSKLLVTCIIYSHFFFFCIQHMMKISYDVVKRWINEAQEAASSDNIMVQVLSVNHISLCLRISIL